MRYTDDSFSIRGRSHGSHIRRNREFDYDEGHVVTPYGIVGVYAQGGGMDQNYSSLSFALNGRQHTRGATHPWSTNPWVWVIGFRRAAGEAS